MLDTYGRKHVDKFINYGAKMFIKIGISANGVTTLAFLIGMLAAVLLGFKENIAAVIVLWVSGYLDSVDGAVARISGTTSEFGALMDIVFDRMVEGGIIIAIAITNVDSRFPLIILSISIILSMTIFLTVGALADKKGIKAFYYQAGVAERTEGFIMFSLMMIFTQWINVFTIIFAGMVLFTAFQRLLEAKKILG